MQNTQDKSSLFNALSQSQLMLGVGIESVGAILENCTTQDVPADHLLISPESKDCCLYLLMEGELAVYLDASMQNPITTISVGTCAGEMSLIDNQQPSAWVRSNMPCRLLTIDEHQLWKLVNRSHKFAHNMLIVLSQRLRFDNDLIVSSHRIVDQYRRNATTDTLTDLNNRYWMRMMFARRMLRAQRHQKSACMAILDLDHFKAYNDQLGHPQGDEVLRLTAACLRDMFRSTDLIARYGGDEFAVYLPDTSLSLAQSIGERVRQSVVTRLQTITQGNYRITMSMGVAELQEKDTLDSLTQRADEALYRAKAQGRNCVSL